MLTIVSGVGLLLITLAGFSLFSLKAPKGQAAMSGMANAAIATFLVEAIHKYITGDLIGLEFSVKLVRLQEDLEALRQELWFRLPWEQIRFLQW